MYALAAIIEVKKLTGSAEGPFTCSNVTIQNNDIGPCGSDVFQEVPIPSPLGRQMSNRIADK